jgi:hypothetical protein
MEDKKVNKKIKKERTGQNEEEENASYRCLGSERNVYIYIYLFIYIDYK